MAGNEPMSDARLAEIRAREPIEVAVNHNITSGGYLSVDEAAQLQVIMIDRDDLLIEVKRLRAENAAMRPIVEAVAAPLETAREHVCMCEGPYDGPHEPHCIVAQARAFVAQREGQGA